MIRGIITIVLCAVAVFAGDIAFRRSLLDELRPVIVSPMSRAVLEPPVQVRWEGPQRMRLRLSVEGEEPRDLGIHESPVEIGADQFPRDGGYQVELQGLRFGSWIRASRQFQIHTTVASAPAQPDHPTNRLDDTKNLLHALEAARTARDRAHGRTKFLSEENAALREESERLTEELQSLYKTQEDDATHIADLERRLGQLNDENRALAEENTAIRARLGAVVPCTVWGYYGYPQPQTVPIPRRFLMVSDPRGQIFRAQAECEIIRRADVTAASICFCVGNSWGG